MSREWYYLMDKTKSRVVIVTELELTALSGNMYYLDKEKLGKLPSECKPYLSYIKAKVIAWLYDLEVVKRSELVDIFYNLLK